MHEPRNAGREQPSIWAGVECTVNRVDDRYIDQCEKNGHSTRIEDLRLFSELGIHRIRYPFLWEKFAPRCSATIDWSWADERLAEMQKLGLTPIAGLLHHGSGPKYTSMVDPEFPEKFADYAGRFAERFPWVTDYTPVNEPLTTARFSGLYGVWYPHGKTDRKFLRCLYSEVKGTVLAMKAIRRFNPQARLIQTEDMGRANGTFLLEYQIEFENERRWLSYDLLCGKVTPSHKLYRYLVRNGISEDELDWLVENPCPPQVLGVNHYLLSNRFLDHRLEHYPEFLRGGNGKHEYADVGAVDTGAVVPPTPKSILKEAWERYGIPIAVTEVHVNGPREAQMQWLAEVWGAACELKAEGADIEAVTAWSLLGSYDWNSLCTKCDDFYESGVFDLRAPKPRPTALAGMLTALAKKGEFQHPVLEQKGWWHHSERAIYGRVLAAPGTFQTRMPSRPLLITGKNGTLGKAFSRIAAKRALSHQVVGRSDLDIADERNVREVLKSVRPWAVVNTAGYVRVDDAEGDEERCFRENVIGPEILARECARLDIPLVNFSSDLVFGGDVTQPYVESSGVSPLNVYGRTKVEAERRVLGENPRSLLVRTSSFFGPWDEHNFVTHVLRALAAGRPVKVANDLTISPTYVPDLVHGTLDMLIDGVAGVLHLTNEGSTSWSTLAEMAVGMAEKNSGGRWDRELIHARPSAELGYAAARPIYSALSTERARVLPSMELALERYFKDLEVLIRPGVEVAHPMPLLETGAENPENERQFNPTGGLKV